MCSQCGRAPTKATMCFAPQRSTPSPVSALDKQIGANTHSAGSKGLGLAPTGTVPNPGWPAGPTPWGFLTFKMCASGMVGES